MNKYYGIIISLIAGLSTVIGYFSIYIKGNKEKIIASFLSFSSGVMLMISCIDLLPSSINYFNFKTNLILSFVYSFLFFFIGFIFSFVIDKRKLEKDELYKTGIMSMIGIIVHNIPEGIATYVLSVVDIKLGILFGITIIMHNIPEGIAISIPIYYSTKSKIKTLFYVLIAGFSETLGAVISSIFLSKYVSITMIGGLYSFISGLMIHISVFVLHKTSKKYDKNVKNFTLLGILLVLIIEIILKI